MHTWKTKIYCTIGKKSPHPTPNRVPSSLLEWPRCEGGRLVKLIYRTPHNTGIRERCPIASFPDSCVLSRVFLPVDAWQSFWINSTGTAPRRLWPFWKRKNIGLLWGKVPMFCLESTEVCLKEVRCFTFPEPTPQKNFFWFSPTFLHPSMKIPLYIGDFRWRIGCRIAHVV